MHWSKNAALNPPRLILLATPPRLMSTPIAARRAVSSSIVTPLECIASRKNRFARSSYSAFTGVSFRGVGTGGAGLTDLSIMFTGLPPKITVSGDYRT